MARGLSLGRGVAGIGTAVVLSAAAAAPAQDLDELRRRGVLRVIVERADLVESAAFGVAPNAFERELLEGFAVLNKLTVKLVQVENLAERLVALAEGRGDLVGGLIDTPERRRTARFTREVLPVRHVVVNRAPQPPIFELAALRSARVGTIPGTSWAEELRAAGVGAARLDTHYNAPADVVEALLAGKVSAAVLSTRYGVLARRKHPELQLGLLLGKPSSVAYAVRPDQPQLLAALDAYIDNVRRTQTWSRLVLKHFGQAGLEMLQPTTP